MAYSLVKAGEMEYAGFWIRLGAWFIDYLIMAIVSAIIYVPLTFMGFSSFDEPAAFAMIQLISTVLNFIIPAAYESWFVGKYAATPGKMACKLKVVMSDGDRVEIHQRLDSGHRIHHGRFRRAKAHTA